MCRPFLKNVLIPLTFYVWSFLFSSFSVFLVFFSTCLTISFTLILLLCKISLEEVRANLDPDLEVFSNIYILFMAFIGKKLLPLLFFFSELSECLLSSGSDLEDFGSVLTQNCCLPQSPDYGSLKQTIPACNGARMSCTPCDFSYLDVYPVHLRYIITTRTNGTYWDIYWQGVHQTRFGHLQMIHYSHSCLTAMLKLSHFVMCLNQFFSTVYSRMTCMDALF